MKKPICHHDWVVLGMASRQRPDGGWGCYIRCRCKLCGKERPTNISTRPGYLSLPVTDRRRANKLRRRQVDPEDIDNQMAMIAGLTDAATDGDARAAAVLVKLLGEETPPGDADAGEVQIIDDL